MQVLGEAETTTIEATVRELGVSTPSIYRWKGLFSEMEVEDIQELRHLWRAYYVEKQNVTERRKCLLRDSVLLLMAKRNGELGCLFCSHYLVLYPGAALSYRTPEYIHIQAGRSK